MTMKRVCLIPKIQTQTIQRKSLRLATPSLLKHSAPFTCLQSAPQPFEEPTSQPDGSSGPEASGPPDINPGVMGDNPEKVSHSLMQNQMLPFLFSFLSH